jgi:hypothetical protein
MRQAQHHRPHARRRGRLSGVVVLAFASLATSVTILGQASPASAATQCAGSSTPVYQWDGWYVSNYANRGVEGDIDFTDISVQNPSYQHGLLYLSSNSSVDSNNSYDGYDWVQAGYGIGSVDAAYTSSTKVYEENEDYSTGGAVASYFTYSLGNHYYQMFFDGTTDSQGRGQYLAYYGLGSNQHYLGQSWEVNPTGNRFFAQFEGTTWNATYNCPYIDWGLLGSTGNINSPTSTSSTQLQIYDNNPAWVQWNYANITTSANSPSGNYTLTTYDQFYLTEQQGD